MGNELTSGLIGGLLAGLLVGATLTALVFIGSYSELQSKAAKTECFQYSPTTGIFEEIKKGLRDEN